MITTDLGSVITPLEQRPYELPDMVASRLIIDSSDSGQIITDYTTIRRFNDELEGQNKAVRNRVRILGSQIWQLVLHATE